MTFLTDPGFAVFFGIEIEQHPRIAAQVIAARNGDSIKKAV